MPEHAVTIHRIFVAQTLQTQMVQAVHGLSYIAPGIERSQVEVLVLPWLDAEQKADRNTSSTSKASNAHKQRG